MNRLVEGHHEALRLGEDIDPAEGEQRQDPERKGSQDKQADNSWADLGFHGRESEQ